MATIFQDVFIGILIGGVIARLASPMLKEAPSVWNRYLAMAMAQVGVFVLLDVVVIVWGSADWYLMFTRPAREVGPWGIAASLLLYPLATFLAFSICHVSIRRAEEGMGRWGRVVLGVGIAGLLLTTLYPFDHPFDPWNRFTHFGSYEAYHAGRAPRLWEVEMVRRWSLVLTLLFFLPGAYFLHLIRRDARR
ncbi:MAG: hypothetical protein D6812_09055 [Deltaproteobacteria bacterium]|nr:MAG: hypothetical protein D6812_09055 [Deltaproteobacteria bacterium]